MQNQYSLRSPAVKRLMKEAQELKEATETYYAHPLEDNLFEWHFTIRGPEDSEFDGGIYHGRIILPPEYPMKPPSIILLTPNGRFETFKKICLSISGHHPESWQPSWSIRTALLAIIGFMPTHGNGAIGSLDYTPEERKILARRSVEFKCSTCGPISTILKPVTEASKESNREAKELAQQINFQGEKEKKGNSESESKSTSSNEATANAAAGVTSPGAEGVPPVAPAARQMPGFPMGFPPFMQQAMRPPSSTGSGVPPQFFMPPFWPQRFNQPPTSNSQPRMPLNPFWPPGFMMPPGMGMPASNTGLAAAVSVQSLTQSSSTQPSSSSASSSESGPSSSAKSGQALPTVSSPSQSNPPTVTTDTTTTTTLLPQGSDRTESQEASSSSTTSAPTTPAESSASSEANNTLRQRQVGENAARVQRTNASAEVLQPRPQRSGGSGCLGFLMVLVVLALAFLILRRMYMMNLLEFNF